MLESKLQFFIFLVLSTATQIAAQRIRNDIWTSGLELSYDSYENWSQQINDTQPFLIVYPRASQQVASIVNWAYTSGLNVRVQGHRHSYPPITVGEQDDPSKVVIIDMTRHMKQMRMSSMTLPDPVRLSAKKLNTVIAEPGASMEDLFTFTERNGFGLVMAPIIGDDATVGGVLAIGGHGAAIPALNEKLIGPGYTFGSVSNYIVELKAVVWNDRLRSYVIKTFKRNNPDISAFLVHVGRAIITEVTIMVGRNYNMRCVSRVDVPSSELFAHPNNASGARTMTAFMDEVGRVDAIWFPYVDSPWLKLWEVSDTKPPSSRLTLEPYNYQFTYTIDDPQVPGPVFGRESMRNLTRGLTENDVWDIWGPSKNTILYYNRTSAPLAYSGFVVLTSRANMQLVLHEIAQFWLDLLDEYGARGIYPIAQYIKLRVTGLDDPKDTLIPDAIPADVSPTAPVRSRPDFNVGVWMNTLTTTRRPFSDEFMKKFEQFVYSRFNGNDGLARPEWSKNWGHGNFAPFEDSEFIRETIPRAFGIAEWNHAVQVWDKYDPHRVISNRFLRELLVPFKGDVLGLATRAGGLPSSSLHGDHDRVRDSFGWRKDYNSPQNLFGKLF